MTLTDWQRIEKVVHYTGFTVNAFARSIGLSRAENLYQIKRGNNGISKQLADTITKRYPEISRIWLLTGEGDMLIDPKLQSKSIPCYDADISFVVLAHQMPLPTYVVSLPRLGDVDFGAMSLAGSLAPGIPIGVTLFVKRCTLSELVMGEAYLVVMRNGVLLRYVRQGDEGNLFLMATDSHHDSFQVSPDDILKLYIVKGFLKTTHQ